MKKKRENPAEARKDKVAPTEKNIPITSKIHAKYCPKP